MEPPFTVGLIGAGIIAWEHAAAIAGLPSRFRLTAIAEISEERRSAFAQEFGIPQSFAEGSDLIAQSDCDLVVVCTPPALHEVVAVAALEAGKVVVCEKPIAHTLESARRILECAARNGNRLCVGHQMRFSDEHLRLRHLCAEGALGSLKTAVVERHGEVPSLHGSGGWWGKWSIAGGGVAITQMIHELDLLISVFGEPISVVASTDTAFTRIESEDAFEALVTFPEGRTAVCRGSVNSGRNWGIFRVAGRDGEASLPSTLILPSTAAERRVISRLNRELPGTCPPSSSLPARILRKLGGKFGVNPRPNSPHLAFYRALSDSVQHGGAMPVSAASAMPALHLCMGIYESAIRGEAILLPLPETSSVYRGITPQRYAERVSRSVPNLLIRKKPGLRIGLLGLDTSHAPTFAGLLNHPNQLGHLPGASIVAAWPGGSNDMEISRSRVAGFTAELRYQHQVAIHEDPRTVAEACDVLFITASDGRVHPALVEAVAPAGKPIFIDKPFAVSRVGAEAMRDRATQHGARLVGSSAFRYADGFVNLLRGIRERGDTVLECEVRGWLPIEPTQGRYFWYGIHTAEMLVAAMGCGASSVKSSSQGDIDTLEIDYPDGRVGRIVGSRTDSRFGLTLRTSTGSHTVDLAASLGSLSSRLLWAALDQLGSEKLQPIWGASTAGSLVGSRPSRFIDPTFDETIEIVTLLEQAGESFAVGLPQLLRPLRKTATLFS